MDIYIQQFVKCKVVKCNIFVLNLKKLDNKFHSELINEFFYVPKFTYRFFRVLNIFTKVLVITIKKFIIKF